MHRLCNHDVKTCDLSTLFESTRLCNLHDNANNHAILLHRIDAIVRATLLRTVVYFMFQMNLNFEWWQVLWLFVELVGVTFCDVYVESFTWEVVKLF